MFWERGQSTGMKAMPWETHFPCESRIYSDTGCPTVLARRIPPQCGPHTGPGVLPGAEALPQRPGRPSGWIKHPGACSTSSSILSAPAAGLMPGTRRRGQSRGRRGQRGRSPARLGGCPAMRSGTSGPPARDGARSRRRPPRTAALIPLLGHPRAKKYNTCRIRV